MYQDDVVDVLIDMTYTAVLPARSVPAHSTSTVPSLRPRECVVLTLVADGLSTREVARRMCYSERTIKNILQELTTRVGLRNRTQAVAWAMRNGWI
ncbi:MAG TPA: LuxR C-terminal-related transcriptional regulator [Jatrophihabitans sp.]|jgi:DNA-binding NarL/FixJ family response regulator